MWAPADFFTPMINAVALALKRAMTFATDNVYAVVLAAVLVIVALVVVVQLRRRDRA